jgi:hypothetical protein
MYYIEVGKRKTRIALSSMTRCAEVSENLAHKLGRKVVLGTPQLITAEFYETEPRNRADRACKILDLI